MINQGNSRVVISVSSSVPTCSSGPGLHRFHRSPPEARRHDAERSFPRFSRRIPDHRSSIYGDFVDRSGRTVRSGVSLKVDSAPSGRATVGAPMKWFMRLTNGGVGMHVGILPDLPGFARLHAPAANIAPLIYQKVKIGTEVVVET